MKKMILSLVLVFIFLSSSSGVYAQNLSNEKTIHSDGELDDFILNTMRQRHIPGLSASLVIDDIVRWQKGYGSADISQNISVTNDTLFKIASVSKTITASALMKLYEQGYFDLSDPINAYLPYPVIHSRYPSTNITFHMLLTHSSGIIDNWQYLFYFVGDAPIPFQTFLEEYLVPGGQYYDPENNFGSWEPGTRCQYSNIAVALVGYLVEVITGMNFTDYVESFVFSPLEMNESAWFLRDLNVSHIAMPYQWNGVDYIPYGHIGYVDVPAGDLRTSASQLIHFLTMFINNGSYNEQRVLQKSTVQLMLSPQLPYQPNIGLIFWKSTIGGRIVWGHYGVDFGTQAMMHFDPTTHIGVVVLCNGEADLTGISDAIFDYAETLSNNPPETPQRPSGSIQGKINVKYSYICKTSDPDDDLIYYQWDWGDETIPEWLGPFNSGQESQFTHKWINEGSYNIKVKAKDIHGKESAWSDPLPITMPCSYNQPIPQILELFFQRFLNAFPIQRQLTRY
ncbi:D-aminopeptidase [uncultured archaeon]|nr:D-aminopeptidase [uncultured archaeon]